MLDVTIEEFKQITPSNDTSSDLTKIKIVKKKRANQCALGTFEFFYDHTNDMEVTHVSIALFFNILAFCSCQEWFLNIFKTVFRILILFLSQIEVKVHKFQGNEYRLTPFKLKKTKLCDAYDSDPYFSKQLIQNTNIPEGCPISKGKYEMNWCPIDLSSIPPNFSGKYKLETDIYNRDVIVSKIIVILSLGRYTVSWTFYKSHFHNKNFKNLLET